MREQGPQSEWDLERLSVLLEGQSQPTGVLEGMIGAGGRRIQFTYAQDYAGPALSASMPVRSKPYRDAEARVYFDNLLPEGAARRGISATSGDRPIDEDDVVGLLAVLGGECPGAVMVMPEGSPPPKVPGVLSRDYELLTDGEVERKLRDVANGIEPGETERASLPGVQRKMALSYQPGSEAFLRVRHRAFPTTHLIKIAPIADPRFAGIVANETICMRVAEDAGLPVAQVGRMSIGALDALLVTRYDRIVGGDGTVRRLHQEDAAQALGLDRTLKYEADARKLSKVAGIRELFGSFAGLTVDPAGSRDILRRAVFLNWVLGNNDAHMKNFSLLHPSDGSPPSLAPLYDIVSVEALPGGWRGMAMNMNGKSVAPAVTGSDIEWLAALEPTEGRRTPASVTRGRLATFRDMASGALNSLSMAVADDLATDAEAAPIRAVVASRLTILNRDLGWGLDTQVSYRHP